MTDNELENLVEEPKDTISSRITREISNSSKLSALGTLSSVLIIVSILLFVSSTFSFIMVHLYSFNIFLTLAGYSLSIFTFTFAKGLEVYVSSKAYRLANSSED